MVIILGAPSSFQNFANCGFDGWWANLIRGVNTLNDLCVGVWYNQGFMCWLVGAYTIKSVMTIKGL